MKLTLPVERVEAFNEILEVVRWEFPTSHPVIGGGSLRDTILGAPIKDVDVFLRAKDHNYTLDSELTKRIRCSPQTAAYGRADMHGAWDFLQTIQGYPVQLILADFENLEDLAHTFDIGLSRITYDGERLYASPEFIQDAADKAFRIRRADNAYELARSLKRVERHLGKYPGFRLDPEYAGLITRARQDVPVGQADCVLCHTKVDHSTFRNAISLREYAISGMCQKCQDSVFGPD